MKQSRTSKELQALIRQRKQTSPDGVIRLDVTPDELKALCKTVDQFDYCHAHKEGLFRIAIPTQKYSPHKPKHTRSFKTMQEARRAALSVELDPTQKAFITRHGKSQYALEVWDGVQWLQNQNIMFWLSERFDREEHYALKRRFHQFKNRVKGGRGTARNKTADIINAMKAYKQRNPKHKLSDAMNTLSTSFKYSDSEHFRRRLERIAKPLTPARYYAAL